MRSPAAVTFMPLGAIVQKFAIGGRNITLGFPRQEDYQTTDHPSFGETLGRIPNRLSEGKIRGLNGRDYELARNENNRTTLHGGLQGWGNKIWDGPHSIMRDSKETVQFTLRSADGDEGFPAEVEARVWYRIEQTSPEENAAGEGEEVVLNVEYEIEMVGEEADLTETVCSMTNHAYWNLGDGPTIDGMNIAFASDRRLEVGEDQIPTGHITIHPVVEVDRPLLFGSKGPVIDDCFVLDTDPSVVPLDTRSRPLRRCIYAHHPITRIHLEISTTEPSFQFYSGDGINVPQISAEGGAGTSTPHRGPRSGFAVEPNRYVNAVNHPGWRSMVLLKRGQLWGCRNRIRAWQE